MENKTELEQYVPRHKSSFYSPVDGVIVQKAPLTQSEKIDNNVGEAIFYIEKLIDRIDKLEEKLSNKEVKRGE